VLFWVEKKNRLVLFNSRLNMFKEGRGLILTGMEECRPCGFDWDDWVSITHGN
jgi:hypothetical protein